MDDENKQDQQNGNNESRPRVHIFGMEVDGGSASGGDNGSDWKKNKAENKEEWRKRKEEWKQAHREQREQWKMQHREWRDEHHYGGGGSFWGMLLLFAGVIALLYTMGLISHPFWHAIEPFWPVLLIMWGASIVLGRHWFARFILFLFALAFLLIVIFYGLAKTDSPAVSWLSPNVVSAIQNTQPRQ
jgi:hypothetical protein